MASPTTAQKLRILAEDNRDLGAGIALDPTLVIAISHLLEDARSMLKQRACQHPHGNARKRAQAWCDALDALGEGEAKP